MSDLANPASSFPNPGSNPGGNSAANIPNPFAVASTPPVTPAPVAPMPPVNQSPVTPAAVPPQNPAVVQTAAAAAPQISAPVQTAPTMPVAAPVPPAPAPAAPQTPLPTKVQEKETLVLDIKGQAKKEKAEVEGISFFKQVDEYLINMSGIKLDEKLLFFQLLASMIGAGLPIIDALNLLINQTNNKKLARVITDMRTQIERGESLASAMRNNDDVFDEATCSVVEAGEKSGKLNAILKELVAQYEQISSLTKKIKAVMMYPIIVIVFMLLLTVVVLIFVVPKLEELFGGGENLPLPTRMLINGSDIVLSYWYFLIAGAVGGMFGFLYWKKLIRKISVKIFQKTLKKR